MDSHLEKIKVDLRKNTKKIIIGVSAIGLFIVIGIGFIFTIIKSNINYTKEECRNIALKCIPGEVIREETDINFERATIEYNFKIKDKSNMLREVEVDSKIGAIIDLD